MSGLRDARLFLQDFEGRGYPAVVVPAGLSQEDLNQFLVDSGYQIPSLPVIKDASVGGVMATGSHVSNHLHVTNRKLANSNYARQCDLGYNTYTKCNI